MHTCSTHQRRKEQELAVGVQTLTKGTLPQHPEHILTSGVKSRSWRSGCCSWNSSRNMKARRRLIWSMYWQHHTEGEK